MLKITQFSDPHLTTSDATLKGYDTFSRFKSCVENAQAHPEITHNEIFILSGDIAHDELSATYVALRDYLDGRGGHWFYVPGNHDSPERLHEIFPTSSPSVALRYKEVAFSDELSILLLSSHVPGEVGGALDEGSLSILGKEVGKPKLVVLHHPPLSLGDPVFDAMGLQNHADFWSAVEANPDVIGVLFGHAHRAYHEDRVFGERRVTVLGCPSTAFQYGEDVDAPYGFDPSRLGYRQVTFCKDEGLKTSVCWLQP